MSKTLATLPISMSRSSVSAAQTPQIELKPDQDFGQFEVPSFGLDPALLPATPQELGPKNQLVLPSAGPRLESNSSSRKTPKATTQMNTDGEPVEEVMDATAQLLALEKSTADPAPPSFLSSSWPYFLVVLALVGWGISQLFAKRAPSFKHHVIEERQQNRTGPKLSGEFKASQRFQKKENEDESITSVPNSPAPEAKLPNRKTNTVDSERPADDEFELGVSDHVSGSDSDSEIIESQEATEIVADLDARQTKAPHGRFKTDNDHKNLSPNDKV